MQLFNICTKKDIEKDGVKKRIWFKAGELKIADSGSRYITLYHLPDTVFFVFDREEAETEDAVPSS